MGQKSSTFTVMVLIIITTTTTQQLFYGPLSGTTQVSQYQKKHSLIQSLSASSIYHNPQHPPCSNYVLGNLFAQPFSMLSLVHLLVWSPPPPIPYISSPNQCLLFATHAHTIATCFAVVSILHHLFLVFLSTPYLELYRLP